MIEVSGVIRACAVEDELVTEDGALVLVGRPGSHRVVRLSPMGQLIRELAADGITFDRLVTELESRLGAPPEGESRDLVKGFVTDLEADGVVASTSRRHANRRNIARHKL